ncbi:hypothetical protein PCC8801_4176 [Rippkaea orientalis PCC 8801]|uniref:Uncharacterized protein n=1 Tax=Rippkaea orientalis (strain PCC 8801 / RF-1) TaxID=41431 RepID=B7K653_RIPO1|nr:hypothetical protein [Rippkaea orientalis]ACK68106.1 hypothetical protein PCC8801_4176 [Rippkaea orientalis PCC 8801]
MLDTQNHHKICVVDYYLDGYYLNWKEVNEEEFPAIGQFHRLCRNSGIELDAKVIKIEEQSETEYRVFLISS